MEWIKRGLIYNVEKKSEWAYSHCHKPTPIVLEDKIRIFFGVRDIGGRTRTTFIDVDKDCPKKILYVHNKPALELGKLGTFDDCGTNVCSVIRVPSGNDIYMYTIGWNPSTTVHTRNSIGLAQSNDGGTCFHHKYHGPILDRNKIEPYYTGAVDVKIINGEWKMWYTSGNGWKVINDKPEIQYHIKFARSLDGIDWRRDNVSCILPANEYEVTARPCVMFEDGIYKMWYSRRSIVDFRENGKSQYRAGYAESLDGENWDRKDEVVGIDVSDSGWDDEAIAYPYVLGVNDKKYMFYNGNGFGRTGFGYAELK